VICPSSDRLECELLSQRLQIGNSLVEAIGSPLSPTPSTPGKFVVLD